MWFSTEDPDRAHPGLRFFERALGGEPHDFPRRPRVHWISPPAFSIQHFVRYDFATLEGPVRAALQAWADLVWAITGQSEQASNVVALRV
jgi:hypothetical protein